MRGADSDLIVDYTSEDSAQIRLLGPVAITPPGGRSRFMRGRPARLLAALALQPGRPVWQSMLIDVVWGNDLPRAPRPALHNVVYRLRRELGEAGLERAVVEGAAGYVLDVAPENVDAVRFEREVSECKADRLVGEEGILKLRRGLALWRGMALEGISGSSAPLLAAAQRLESLRISAFESLCAAELARGNFKRVIPELRAVTSEQDTNERLHGLLMIGLYQAGWQSESLGVFRSIERRLRSEYGLTPAPTLANLELAILDHDAAEVEAYLTARVPSFR